MKTQNGTAQESTGGMPEIGGKDTSSVPEIIYTAGKLERIIEIKRYLLQYGCLSAPNLATRVKTCDKTIRRDIDFMRTRMDMDIETTPEGFRLIGPVGLLPGEKLSDNVKVIGPQKLIDSTVKKLGKAMALYKTA